MGWLRSIVLGCVVPLWLATAAFAEERTVTIATEGASPPFNFLDQNNEPQGFEVDLGRALCATAKLKCDFVVHEWEGIVRDLIAKRYDAVMASVAITAKRKARIAFSRPYYRIPATFIMRKDAEIPDASPAALAGKSVGTTERSEHVALIETVYPQSQLRLYGTFEDAALDLLTRRIDLVLGDKLALTRFLESREGECCRILADLPENRAIYGEGIGIGLRKEDKDLRQAFDRAIDQVMADGTYDRIRAKYFSFDIR